MSKKTGLILACLLASATSAFAQAPAACVEPASPPAVDGNTITRPELIAAIAAVKDFIAKSDLYQTCLGDNLNAQKAAAVKNQTPFDPAIQQTVLAKVEANQQAKVKAGTDVNAASVLFKKAHPTP